MHKYTNTEVVAKTYLFIRINWLNSNEPTIKKKENNKEKTIGEYTVVEKKKKT